MTGYQRSVWFTSVLLILFSLALCTLSIVGLLLGSGSLAGVYGGFIAPMSALFIFTSILGICQAVFQFVVGCVGIRHCNDPHTTEAMFVLGIVVFITSCATTFFFGLCMGTAGATNPMWPAIIGVISSVIAAVFMYSTGRVNAGARHPMVY